MFKMAWSRWLPFAFACALVLVIFPARYPLDEYLPASAVGLLFAPLILVAAIMGGLLPGVFATLIAAPPVFCLSTRHVDSLVPPSVNLALFGIVGTLVTFTLPIQSDLPND